MLNILANNNNRRRKIWKVMNKFMALMVVTVSRVYTFPQIHLILHIKNVQLPTCQSYLNKVA